MTRIMLRDEASPARVLAHQILDRVVAGQSMPSRSVINHALRVLGDA